VGDCHYHAIITKWTKLQGHALRIVEECPDIVHKVHYESILQDKENVVKEIYGFIGERRFGGIKRQASVLFMNPTEDLINSAKIGREAQKSMGLSYQFQNLGRGPSFTNRQLNKWLHLETGLKMDDIQLIESVAHETMEKLSYDTHLVGVSATPTLFTVEDIMHFNELNKDGIQKMNDDLHKENPGDFDRRVYQAEVLSFPPTLLEENRSSWTQTWSDTPCDSSCASYLTDFDLELRLSIEPEGIIPLQEGGRVRWGSASQRGYYPFEPDKPNQDASKSQVGIVNEGNLHWFSVFDGHGPDGHKCAEYATVNIPTLFASEVSRGGSVKSALETAHLTTHEHILTESSIDSRQSGTTAVSLLLENKKCFVSNVGDSTCILGSRTTTDGVITAKHLCTEHTPLRADERERIERAGGVIMTVDQRDGIAPMNDHWNKRDCPPRIWAPKTDDGNKFPGCGFTRSIGDSVAHSLGVEAKPEIFEYVLEKKDRVLIVASDGITECT
jgi:serine/threonine protein phosphatase PrpC